MPKSIFTSFVVEDEPRVDAWLQQKGVRHTIGDLYHDSSLCPECGSELLEVFKTPLSFNVRTAIASALFARKLNASQKREAVQTLLDLIKQNPGREYPLSSLILNELAANVTADRVHEIGEMLLDERLAGMRGCFTEPLRKIGSAAAISYLKQAATIPEAASLALNALARLRVEDTLELCEQALKTPGILYRDAIKETHKKLQRKMARKTAAISHVTGEPIPEGLEEWSTNLDSSDLAKVLRGIQKCVEGGLGKDEITEARAAAGDLSPEGISGNQERDVVRLKFEVMFNGGVHQLWLEVVCDDEDAFDLYVFGHPKLIKEIESVLEKILPE